MTGGLAQRLLALGPASPLGDAGARELVTASLLGADAAGPAAERVTLGPATGRVLLPAGGRMPAPGEGIACAIGAFDGVHRGHRELLGRLAGVARERGAAPVVVTFSPDPADVLSGARPSSELLPVGDRARALAGLAGAPVVSLDFTPALSRLAFDEFVGEVLSRLGRIRALVVGEDFRMGAGGAGDVAALSALGSRDGFDVVGVRLADERGEAISATRVRRLVREGRVEVAAGMLGRCHRVSGEVVHGRGEGTGLGFPTANVAVDARACLPEQGVYAGFVACDRTAWPAAVNVGAPPTFAGAAATPAAFLEANLMGFSGDLYGRRVSVVLVRWLRDSRPFSSLSELERVVLGNVGWVRGTLGERGIDLGGAHDL